MPEETAEGVDIIIKLYLPVTYVVDAKELVKGG